MHLVIRNSKLLILLISISICVQLGQSQNFFSKAKLNPKCKPIGPTKKLDTEWAMSLFAGKKFYLPMGSKTAFEDFTELLDGKKASSPADINKMCAEVKIKAFKSTVEGYDGRYLVIDCAMITKGVQECEANSRTEFPARHKSVHSIQTLAWTDNKENILLVRCTPNADKNDWLLYSTNTALSDEVKNVVHDQISTFGFSPKTMPVHYADYGSCTLSLSGDE